MAPTGALIGIKIGCPSARQIPIRLDFYNYSNVGFAEGSLANSMSAMGLGFNRQN
ncbi:hypothetical protein [Rhodoferax ferrireducens]|uniref:hypothetical protein n=1 Tax=Rhodoferax ferrireducens TaxID=192843 RepID=UPI000315DFF4|nr:hypothetical protein [Rhodoferax ferrireducens]